MARTRRSTAAGLAVFNSRLLLGILVASSFVILGGYVTPQAHAAAQPLPSSAYFGNTYNSTQGSVSSVGLTNTTQLIDERFTARYNGDAIPRVSVFANYYKANATYDVAIGIQADISGSPSGQFLGAFVWNVTSGLCDGCGGWVYPGFAPKAYNLNHTVTLVAGTVYHLVVKYLNGTFVNTGGCYGTDCLSFEYIGGTNYEQESLDMHYDPSQALLFCGSITDCGVVQGANAVYALDINGTSWYQGQTESMVLDRPIGAAEGGTGLDSFQGERFWMAWNSLTVNRLEVLLSKTGDPTGSLNLLIWNFTAPSASDILHTSSPRLMLNESVIPDVTSMSPTDDHSYNFSLGGALTLEYGHMYQISFAIYGNTTTINGSNELGVEVTNSNYNPNPLNWDGSNGLANAVCPQYALGCAGFRYTGATDNNATEEWGYEDLVFMMKVEYAAVAQPISVQMAGSGPVATVSIEGCHATPSTFPDDGAPHLESVDPSCAFSLSFTNNGSSRAGFQVGGDFSNTSTGQTSCSIGTCTRMNFTAFDQVENSFRATPTTPSNWDATVAIPVTGIQLGSRSTGCTVSTTAGAGRAACQAWFDYGTIATMSNQTTAAGGERWDAPGLNTFVVKTGGNNFTVDYVDQFNVTLMVTPVNSGTVHPSGSSLWETYGSLTANETAKPGFGFVSWSTSTAEISLSSVYNASTTATVHGPGTITATFATLVNQPITLALAEQGGRSATFLLSGCAVSPTSIVGNGTTFSVTATPSCSINVSAPADGDDTRYRFSSTGQPLASIMVQTCVQGNCASTTSTYYEQVAEGFAYRVLGGGSPSPPLLRFISLGKDSNSTEAATPTTTWVDFGTGWSLSQPLSGSSQDERWIASSGINGTATVSGDETASYQHEYFIDVVASPADCGVTIPSGGSWEPAGTSFSITSFGSKNCTFVGWNSTEGILVAQTVNANSTVTAQGPGTITAAFTKILLSSSTTNSQILYLVISGAIVVLVGAVALFAKRRATGDPAGGLPKP